MFNNKKIGKNSNNMKLFFLIFFILILGILFSKFRIEINNISYSKNEKNIDIKVILIIFKLIPLKLSRINNEKIKIISKNLKLKKIIDKANIRKISENINFRKLKVKALKIKLYLEYSTNDIFVTTYLTPVISTIISYIYYYLIDNYNEKNHYFRVNPMYLKQQYVYLKFESIIEIRMWNIINIILLNRRKKK